MSTAGPASDQFSVALLMGIVSFCIAFGRALLVLDQEFSDDDDMIANPLSATVSPGTDYDGFRAKSWSGFEALWAAMRFRTFYRRYRPLLHRDHAVVCLIFMLSAVVVVVFVSSVQQVGPQTQRGIGMVIGILSSSYYVLIERGKSLKKAAIRRKM